MQKIVLASSNLGKIAEFSQLLCKKNYKIVPQNELNIHDAEETGLTFVENALIKARHASQASGLPALADDTGLVVDALNGAPGLYSARYAGEHGNSEANIAKVLAEMEGIVERRAYFYCCLVYLRHPLDPAPIIATGQLTGYITKEPYGTNGFGYDSIMFLPDLNCTVAELSAEQKNKLSHRAKALQVLQAELQYVY